MVPRLLENIKKGFLRHGKNFVKFGASGEENGQASDIGEDSNNEWNGLIAACGTVKSIRFEGGSLRILFALDTGDNLSGDLKKHQQVSKPKGKISQGNEKAKEALRDEVGMVKRLFELKKWHSNTLETWVYPQYTRRRRGF